MKPQRHHIQKKGITYTYRHFTHVAAFNAFVDAQIPQLRPANRTIWKGLLTNTQALITRKPDWYGHPPVSRVRELEEHTHFQGMHLLDAIHSKIKATLSQYLKVLDLYTLPKPKLAYHDRGLGMFSFDRAAMGMYRSNPVDVSSPLSKTTSQLRIALGKTGLFTNVKKVYGYFQHKRTEYPAIQLYLLAGANAKVKGDQMLYVGLACGELVEFLEQRGVAVQVHVLVGTSFSNRVIMGVVRIKAFEQPLDKNQLLLLSSDPRYFRFRGFKALIALSDFFDLTIPKSLGRIQPAMGKNFVQALGNDGVVFEQSYSLDGAAKEVHTMITSYSKRLRHEKAA